MTKNFYFMLKTLVVLEIFSFLFSLFTYVEKRLDKKAMVNSRIYYTQTGQQIITMHISLKLSRSKGNQTIKLRQLIKYSVRNIFLQKSGGKWERETSSRTLFVFSRFLYKVKASGQHLSFNNTQREKLNTVQETIKVKSFQLLIFLISLQNWVQMFKQRDSSSRQKMSGCSFQPNLTAKLELVFVLTQKNTSS